MCCEAVSSCLVGWDRSEKSVSEGAVLSSEVSAAVDGLSVA